MRKVITFTEYILKQTHSLNLLMDSYQAQQ